MCVPFRVSSALPIVMQVLVVLGALSATATSQTLLHTIYGSSGSRSGSSVGAGTGRVGRTGSWSAPRMQKVR